MAGGTPPPSHGQGVFEGEIIGGVLLDEIPVPVNAPGKGSDQCRSGDGAPYPRYRRHLPAAPSHATRQVRVFFRFLVPALFGL